MPTRRPAVRSQRAKLARAAARHELCAIPTVLAIGSTGTLVTATRGSDGPGEVQVSLDGGSEIFIAYSDRPLPMGTVVAIYEIHPGRRVDVEAIKGAP